MTYETRLLIRQFAEDYLMSFPAEIANNDKFPVNIESVIKQINGTIFEHNDINFSDGYIKYTNQGIPPSFEIHLKKITNELQKRFTLAHELGHLILHMDFFNEKARNIHEEGYYRTIGSYTEKELQADEFAASFLMPSQAFIRIASENMVNYGSTYNISSIANRFGVSKSTVITRGQFFGIFSWDS